MNNWSWSAEDVSSIAAEYRRNPLCFLCNSSRTFFKLWERHQDGIRALANDFLNNNVDERYYVGVTEDSSLFVLSGEKSSKRETRRIRLLFLRYELERLERHSLDTAN